MTMAWSIGVTAATDVIKVGVDYLKAHDAEETQREWIRTNHQAFLAALKAKENALIAYIDRTFDERRATLEEFYSVLHKAVDSKNDYQLDRAIVGILGIIKDNPLFNPAAFKNALEDPEKGVVV